MIGNPQILKTSLLIYGMGAIGQKTAEVIRERGGDVLAFLDRKACPEARINALPVMTPAAWLEKNDPAGVSVIIGILNETFLPKIPALRVELAAMGFSRVLDMQGLALLWPETAKEVTRFYNEVQEWNRRFEHVMDLYRAGEYDAINRCFPFAERFEKYRSCSHCEFWLVLTASLLLRDQREKAEDVLKKYMSAHGLKEMYRYYPVARYVRARGIRDEMIEKAIFVTERLVENRTAFVEMLFDKTVACVGNGPQEIGENRGAEIDAHDIVIRFNNFELGAEHTGDYGRKTDVWAESFASSADRSNTHALKAILVTNNITCSRIEDGLQIEDAHFFDRLFRQLTQTGIPVFSIPTKVRTNAHMECRMQVDKTPTSGFLTLYWLLRWIKPKSIDCYGFSFLGENMESSYRHYYPDALEEGRNAKRFHDMGKESQFLRQFFDERGHARSIDK